MNAKDMHIDAVINTVIEYMKDGWFHGSDSCISCGSMPCEKCIFNDVEMCIKCEYVNKLKERFPEYYI